MAKRKAAPKTKAAAPPKRKKAAPKKQTRREVEQVLRKGAIRRPTQPVQRELVPGARALPPDVEEACENIGNGLDEINAWRQTVAGYEQSAMRLMRKHGLMSAKHAGVTLVRIPGEEKLSVRRTTKGANAESEPEEKPVTAMDADETPEGQRGPLVIDEADGDDVYGDGD